MPVIPVRISADGTSVCIYDDVMVPRVAALRELGAKVEIHRVSHVEPDNETGHWLVDMGPLGGEIHRKDENGYPFYTRQAALDFEVRIVQRYFRIREEKMLVLSRKVGEKLIIGEGDRKIVVTVVKGGTDKIRIGIEAPVDVMVLREEIVGTERAKPHAK